MLAARAWGEEEMENCCSMCIKFLLCKVSSRDLLHIVPTVNNTIMCTLKYVKRIVPMLNALTTK